MRKNTYMTALRAATGTIAALLLSGVPQLAVAASAAGEVVLITGRGSATDPAEGGIRELAKGDALFAGDIINSSVNSYINLRFADGSFVLLRPNTRFVIEEYAYTGAVSAPVAPVAPAAARPSAPAQPATAAGGGWKLNVESYADEAYARRVMQILQSRGQPAQIETIKAPKGGNWYRVVVAGVADRRAAQDVVAELQKRGYRNASILGGADRTAPAAPALVAPAAPPSRPAIPPSAVPPAPPATATAPAITPPPAGSSRAFFRLVRGGFRAVSGLIGQVDRNEYRVSTPVATIGIRGTDYLAVVCDAACARDPVLREDLPPGAGAEGGLIAGVIDGGIGVTTAIENAAVQPRKLQMASMWIGASAANPAGPPHTELGPGQYLAVTDGGTHVPLDGPPRFLVVNPIPNPTNVCPQ